VRVKCELLHGGTDRKERARIVGDVRNRKVQILISTLSLIGEGFDAPNLTALFLTTPIKFKGRLIQTCGRILRPEKNKNPRIYDFRDTNVKLLRYGGINRDKIYKDTWG